MTIYYSATTRGFYDTLVAAYTLPGDAVEVTPQEHARLMARQREGAVIVAREDGTPADAIPELSIQTRARVLLRRGLTIESDTIPEGVYPCDDGSIAELSLVLVGLSAGFGFPGGSTYQIRLLNDGGVAAAEFTDQEKLRAVARALFAFRYHCLQAANGFTNVLPDDRVTL